MGIITDALGGIQLQNVMPVPLPRNQQSVMQPAGRFESFARSGYMSNEIVFSAIELLASSAGEPHIVGRRLRRDRATVRSQAKRLKAFGAKPYAVNDWLIRNKFIEEVPNHPAVQLVNQPNPFMSRGQLWGTVVMDRMLAGNAYLVKARGRRMGNTAELWRLRPDRVKVVPSSTNFVEGYEYKTGAEKPTFLPASEVIHFKSRNPLDDHYGMPPLMAAAGRVDIDNYMRSFLRTFFERGGTGPGSVLSVKQRLTQEAKDEIRDRFKRQFGATGGFHEIMVLDQAESTYTQMGLNRGLRDALPKEIDALQEARLAMVFGIPGSILGLLIGYESSSYANKRADWQVFWDITMSPLLSSLDDVLNLHLVPEFSGIDELAFDLDDIKALQEDVDAVQDRERKNLMAGVISLEEYRDAIGLNPKIDDAGLMFVPRTHDIIKGGELGKIVEVPPEPLAPDTVEGPQPVEEEGGGERQEPQKPIAATIAEPRCPDCGRRNGANVNAGASLDCKRCGNYFVVS